MTLHDHASELDHLTRTLADEGWEPIHFDHTLPTGPPTDDCGFHLLVSPDRLLTLTATWHQTHTAASLSARDRHEPDLALWSAHTENLPVGIVLAAARAATDPDQGRGPFRLLRDAGWTKNHPVTTSPGSHAIIVADPAAARTATATYLSHAGQTVRGPWLISRDDLSTTPGARAFGHTAPTAPGSVIAALALSHITPAPRRAQAGGQR